MRIWFYIMGILALSPFLIDTASAQLPISLNSTQACFFNYTAGWRMWQQCGLDADYVAFSLLPWEWISGGYFSAVLAALIALFTYIKYQKVAYPIITGMMLLPVSYFLFPDIFLVVVFSMSVFGMAALVYYAFLKQTKEY